MTPASQPAQPGTSGAGTDPRAQLGGVAPASYQSADLGAGRATTAAMISPASSTGSEYYGAYQGAGSPATAGPTSATIYNASSSSTAPPALLQNRNW
jgi:hypothetical protein